MNIYITLTLFEYNRKADMQTRNLCKKRTFLKLRIPIHTQALILTIQQRTYILILMSFHHEISTIFYLFIFTIVVNERNKDFI